MANLSQQCPEGAEGNNPSLATPNGDIRFHAERVPTDRYAESYRHDRYKRSSFSPP